MALKAFPSKDLQPSGGKIYCHIFENQRTGVARNLFWSVTVDFEPIQHGEDEWSCNLMCEWMAWPLRHWRQLDGKRLDCKYGENGVESSFYMTEHDVATHTKLYLRHRSKNIFTINVDMLVDFHGFYDGDENPAMPVHAEVDVPFIGLIIMPDNLFPKPLTLAELRTVASEFVDLSAYEESEPWQSRGSIFRPTFH